MLGDTSNNKTKSIFSGSTSPSTYQVAPWLTLRSPYQQNVFNKYQHPSSSCSTMEASYSLGWNAKKWCGKSRPILRLKEKESSQSERKLRKLKRINTMRQNHYGCPSPVKQTRCGQAPTAVRHTSGVDKHTSAPLAVKIYSGCKSKDSTQGCVFWSSSSCNNHLLLWTH